MTSNIIGRRAIAAIVSAGLVFGTVTAAPMAPTAIALPAPANNKTADGYEVREANGNLTITGLNEEGAPGDIIAFQVDNVPTFFDKQTGDTGDWLAVKIDDGTKAVDPDLSGTAGKAIVGDYVRFEGPFPNRTATITMRIPAGLSPGMHSFRILNPEVTETFWFKVTESSAAPVAQRTAEVKNVSKSRSGDLVANVLLSGFAEGTTLKATVNGKPATIAAGRDKVEEITADGQPSIASVVIAPETGATAGNRATIEFTDNDGNKVSAMASIPAFVNFTKDGASEYSIGSTVTATVDRLSETDRVTFIGVGETNFLTAAQTTPATDGVATFEGVAIPNTAALAGQTITLKVQVDGVEKTFETTSKITPSNAELKVSDFNVTRAELPSGLYQTAYSAKNKALYVTRSVGRPPLKEASLYKVDPETLKIVKEATPPADEKGGLVGPYGIGVLDALNQVWVSNTRQNTVAVYNADTLELIKQFPAGDAHHARDIAVDEKNKKVYVSTPRGGDVIVEFDAEKLTKVGDIKIGEAGVTGPMSLDFDPETGHLVTVSMDNAAIGVVDTRANNAITVHTLDGKPFAAGSGVAYDPKTKQVLIASQDTNNAVIVDTTSGKVVKNILTGAQALSATFDPVNRLFYVANRTGGTLTAIDADKLEIVGNINVGRLPNHVSHDNQGNVFVVNKGGQNKDSETNDLFKISPIAKGGNKPGLGSNDVKLSSDNKATGSSTSALGKVFGALLGIVAAIGGIGALLGHLLRTGVIDVNLLPQEIRNIFHI